MKLEAAPPTLITFDSADIHQEQGVLISLPDGLKQSARRFRVCTSMSLVCSLDTPSLRANLGFEGGDVSRCAEGVKHVGVCVCVPLGAREWKPEMMGGG